MKLSKNMKKRWGWAIYIPPAANGIKQPWNCLEIQKEGNERSKVKNVKQK